MLKLPFSFRDSLSELSSAVIGRADVTGLTRKGRGFLICLGNTLKIYIVP